MRILKYSNEQFAGMRDQVQEFEPGMNVILGDNETGKSTLISGIYSTLMQTTALKKNVDKEFIAQFFPTNGKQIIDGNVELSINNQPLRITKEWSTNLTDSEVVVRTEDGKEKGEPAEKLIHEYLNFGAGVYDNIVFGRQKNEDEILNWCDLFLNPPKKVLAADQDRMAAVNNMKERVSGALSAAGGISEKDFEMKLNQALKSMGSHWDFNADAPERHSGRWSRDVSGVIEAFYAVEDKRSEIDDAERNINDINEIESELRSLDENKYNLKKEKERLDSLRTSADSKGDKEKLISGAQAEINTYKGVLESWPKIKEIYNRAKELQSQYEAYEINKKRNNYIHTIEEATFKEQDIERLQKKLDAAPKIGTDYKNAVSLNNTISKCKIKLGSAKMHASIEMMDGYGMELTALTGRKTFITDSEEVEIIASADMDIPGVAHIRIASQSFDVDEMKKSLEESRVELTNILDAYDVANVDELEELKESLEEDNKTLITVKGELKTILAGRNLADLREELSRMPFSPEAAKVSDDIEEQVSDFLDDINMKTIESAVETYKTRNTAYRDVYLSVDNVNDLIKKKEDEIVKIKKELEKIPDIGCSVEEFNLRSASINLDLETNDIERSKRNTQLGNLRGKLVDVDLADLYSELKPLEKELERRKDEYKRLLDIKSVFEELKKEQGSSEEEFYETFNEYLAIISDNRVSFTEGKNLMSGSNDVNKDILSKGTRNTVLLAFRLAVLKYFFSEEGGVVFLDDVILDMDPTRRKKSVMLLKQFVADGNQVIFTTCDPEIAKLLVADGEGKIFDWNNN